MITLIEIVVDAARLARWPVPPDQPSKIRSEPFRPVDVGQQKRAAIERKPFMKSFKIAQTCLGVRASLNQREVPRRHGESCSYIDSRRVKNWKSLAKL